MGLVSSWVSWQLGATHLVYSPGGPPRCPAASWPSHFVFDAGGPCSVDMVLGTWLGQLPSPFPSAPRLVAPLGAFPARGRRGSGAAAVVCGGIGRWE